jgi:hypothetical protein
MIEHQTYIFTFDQRDLSLALNNIDNNPPFLYPSLGDINVFRQQTRDDNWESGIHQIMEEYDEAWRYLGRL